MDQHLKDVLNCCEDNYILPFFWQHGENEAVLRNEMQQIRSCGIRAVCIEARPHPDFAGPGWWHDLDIIMDEARRYHMKVWVLDDAHFPTGYANGAIRDLYPHLRKWYVMEKHVDTDGPLAGASFLIDQWLNQFDWMHPTEQRFGEDQLLSVIAYRRDEDGQLMMDDVLNLSEMIQDGMLEWDIPEGRWRLFILIKTRDWGGNPDYINPIDSESVHVLIDAVYEPHWNRYKDDFGETLAGFFSDEPSFGNAKGFSYRESIGYPDMVLPWSKDMPALLEDRLGPGWINLLPCLWYDTGVMAQQVRYHYMDTITALYEQNFGEQLGQWCNSHGIEYIGHVIEDQNVHTRLGCGSGHFFRALSGQHMSGIDYIGQQVLPRLESFHETACGSEPDSEFFHFGLAKMGSSLAHLDPKKQGRCLCEIFGASGWGTGVRRMKWMIDHALVRGVNRFVPHAFSAKDFPDPDCPPHFYANGHNPQFRHFGSLMRYTNRMCHILDAGIHIAPVAILYHAEAEWTGDAMFFQKPAHMLMRRQIDVDILPADIFLHEVVFHHIPDGVQIQVNEEHYKVLVIPACSAITPHTAVFIGKALEKGFPVVFVDRRPVHIAGETNKEEEKNLLKYIRDVPIVPLQDLADYVVGENFHDISLFPLNSYLRYYRYQRNGIDIYMLNNEHPAVAIHGKVEFFNSGIIYRYDAVKNCVIAADEERTAEKIILPIHLMPYESTIIYIEHRAQENMMLSINESLRTGIEPDLQIDGEWSLSLATAEAYPLFDTVGFTLLCNQSASSAYPRFSGFFRYETTFEWNGEAEELILDLGQVYDAADVYINGVLIGSAFCPPYRFELKQTVQYGSNSIRIDVVNTLVRVQRDMMSMGMSLDPSGLLGPVQLRKIRYETK